MPLKRFFWLEIVLAIATNLGFPRIGANRELKWATEAYWSGKIDQEELEQRASQIKHLNWKLQREAGIEHIPSNDFSFYDQMLDTSVMVQSNVRRMWICKKSGMETGSSGRMIAEWSSLK